jgi:chloramphenicol 3-O-phosphotransferase
MRGFWVKNETKYIYTLAVIKSQQLIMPPDHRQADYKVLYVGVFSPIEVLEQRETARGDRKIGLARYQASVVYLSSEYDVEVDTHQLSPHQAAQKVISSLENANESTAFDRLRLKAGINPVRSAEDQP